MTWSCKQTKVALLTHESEMNPALAASREAIWLGKFAETGLVKDLVPPLQSIVVYSDD